MRTATLPPAGTSPVSTGAMPPAAPAQTSATVAGALLQTIVDRDVAGLTNLLAPDVWFRAMLVREVVEYHDRPSTVAMFLGWFHRAPELQVLEAVSEPVLTRVFLRYRLRLRPEWAPDVWHTIEQSGYARIADGRVRRLDLVCTGFVPDGA